MANVSQFLAPERSDFSNGYMLNWLKLRRPLRNAKAVGERGATLSVLSFDRSGALDPRRWPCAEIAIVLLAAVLVLPGLASAHGGGLDAYGCHHDRKHGGYHCHRGPLAGRSFKSQAEMLEEKGKAAAEKEEKPERAPRQKR